MDLCPSELVGKSCYRFIHGEDVEGIQQSHLDCMWPQEWCNGMSGFMDPGLLARLQPQRLPSSPDILVVQVVLDL